MHHATFQPADLTTFSRLDQLGLTAVGQRFEPGRVVLDCRLIEPDPWCRRCGAECVLRDTVTRTLAHTPFGHRATKLKIRVRRYRCDWCRKVWREDTSMAAPERAKITRAGLRFALEAVVIDHLTVSRTAANLGVSWHTANTAILAEGHRALISDPARFDRVTVIGVDEHVWRHTRYGDKYVTVLIDLTPVREKRGPARLLDMVPGRSKQVFSRWLSERTQAWRDGIEVVAMDGFTGFKTASKEHLPDAVEVMDPFHVVQLAGLGRKRLRELIDTVKQTTPARFTELRKLAYTLDRRRVDILAYFDHPRTSNGPTEAINGRLEHLRGSALGFRNLTNYIARSLLEAGGFRPYLHSQMR